MWVRTQSGQLVNLMQFDSVKVEHEPGYEPSEKFGEGGQREHWRVIAVKGGTRVLLGQIATSAERAAAFVDMIFRALGMPEDEDVRTLAPAWPEVVDTRIPLPSLASS